MSAEKNVKIAEYIGMQMTNIGWYDAEEIIVLPNECDNTFDDLLFECDWNWLLSVVSLLNESFDENNLDFESLRCTIQDATITNDLRLAYNGVFNFIDKNELPTEE